MEATITISTKADDKLRHNEEVGGQIFKYDLPIENIPIPFKSVATLVLSEEKEVVTPTQNLMEELDCDKDTAFESFIIKHH